MKQYIEEKTFVKDGNIWSIAKDDFELGKYLYNVVILKLKFGVHSNSGKTYLSAGIDFCLNDKSRTY
jgi:hypothetical protein